ncbi:LOW QUALITY PROTEIN: GAS2-like protein 1 [Leptosomus discolor]
MTLPDLPASPFPAHRLPQPRAPGFSPQKPAPSSFSPAPCAPSPSTPRRSRAAGPSSGGGDNSHAGTERRSSHQAKGVGDTGIPKPPAGAKQEGLPPRGGPAPAPSSASPSRSPAGGTLRPRDPAPARSRRCSGDSDSSASSAQSGPPGPRDGGTPRRREPSRGVPPQPPRDAGPSPGGRTAPEERGRSRVPNGPGRASPRARSHGRPGPQPLLLISRRRDGQHSWTRAETPSRPGSPARSRTPARSPAPTPRRFSLEEGGGGRRAEAPHGGGAGEALQRELEELARRLRAPLRLEPGQEQQLFRRLEEEFLANTRMMEELGDDGETPAAAPPPPSTAAAADSAYCSSSSSSSSLNVFGKHGLPAEDGRRSGNGVGPPPPAAPEMADGGRRPALSSSSDESSCFPASWEAREMRGGPESDTDWAPGEDELTEMEELPAMADGPPRGPCVPNPVPSLPAPPPRPWAKPRLDTQPHKKPSRIPTPRGYGAAPHQPPTGSPKPWGALQSVCSSCLEPAWVPREREGLDEDAWP